MRLPTVVGLDLRPVNGHQFRPDQVHRLAHPDEQLEQAFQRLPVPAAEFRDGLVVRMEPLQQPDDFDVPVRLPFQLPTGPHAVEIAIEVQLDQDPGRVGRTSRARRAGVLKAQRRHIEVFDKRVQEPDRVIGLHVILQTTGQEVPLVARKAVNGVHDGLREETGM